MLSTQSVDMQVIQARTEDAVFEKFQIESEDVLSYCMHNSRLI